MEQSEFQGSQHLLRNSQHHGMHLPQHVDAHEGDPPQVPLISQNDQNPEQVLSPNTYFPPPNLQKIPKNPTIHTPYHPAPEAALHQAHAIHQADLPLHQGPPCDLVYQQDLRQLSEEYSHHHSLPQDTPPTLQFQPLKEQVTLHHQQQQVPKLSSASKKKKKVKKSVVENESNVSNESSEGEEFQILSVPNIPVKNFFSCLSNEDSISHIQDLSITPFTPEPNNNLNPIFKTFPTSISSSPLSSCPEQIPISNLSFEASRSSSTPSFNPSSLTMASNMPTWFKENKKLMEIYERNEKTISDAINEGLL